MKKINILIGSVSALAGTLLIVYISFFATVVNTSFLQGTNRDLNIAERIKMSEEDLDAVTESMVSYVKGQKDELQVEVTMAGEVRGFFNDREITHIEDVRDLIRNLRIFICVCAVVFVLGTIYLVKNNAVVALARGYFVSLIAILALAVVVGVFAVVDITAVINGFHYIFFDNDLWIMNPAIDKVVWLFTEGMYLQAIIRIGLCLGSILFIVTIAALYCIKKNKIKNKSAR